ncbi:MAG: 30S ribosomal protein S13 [Candidatus Woesearchaeota archaeon]
MAEDTSFKHIIRVANTDLNGNKPIAHALKKIKGIGFMFANMACNIVKVDKYKKAGEMSDKEISDIDSFISDPSGYGAPSWMLNRRKDDITGEDKHIVMGDLKFMKDNDIRKLKKIRAYKGTRHMFGLPARGQKTKSNFRKNKGKVQGVKKKAPAKASGK